MPATRNFADQIANSLQSFLQKGSGIFELISSLQTIHNSITMIDFPKAPPAVTLMAGVPELHYKGDYHQGKKHGHGLARFPEGRTYEGDWFND